MVHLGRLGEGMAKAKGLALYTPGGYEVPRGYHVHQKALCFQLLNIFFPVSV